MKALELEQMEQIEGGDICAAATGTVGGTGFVGTVGGAVANGAKLTWRLGGKGLLIGVVGGAITGVTCYALS